MTKVPRHKLLKVLTYCKSNHGISFSSQNKQEKNRFRESFRIFLKHERRNSEKYKMQLNNLSFFGKMTKPNLNHKNTRNHTKNIHDNNWVWIRRIVFQRTNIHVHELQIVQWRKNTKNLSLLLLFVNQTRKERRKKN